MLYFKDMVPLNYEVDNYVWQIMAVCIEFFVSYGSYPHSMWVYDFEVMLLFVMKSITFNKNVSGFFVMNT